MIFAALMSMVRPRTYRALKTIIAGRFYRRLRKVIREAREAN